MLRFSTRKLGRLAASVAALSVVLAITASAASAAAFSPSGPVVYSGSLQWKLNGGSPVTCTVSSPGSTAGASWLGGHLLGSCSNGRSTEGYFLGSPNPAPFVRLMGFGGHPQGPFLVGGTYQIGMVNPTPEFVNGTSPTNPSRLVFNNTLLGYAGVGSGVMGEVRVTGSINVTTSTGGLLTLN